MLPSPSIPKIHRYGGVAVAYVFPSSTLPIPQLPISILSPAYGRIILQQVAAMKIILPMGNLQVNNLYVFV